MDAHVRPSMTLTHAGALAILRAAVTKAEAMQVPQCIAVVDAGGNLLAFARMGGAKVLRQHTATQNDATADTARAAGRGPDAGTGGQDVEGALAGIAALGVER